MDYEVCAIAQREQAPSMTHRRSDLPLPKGMIRATQGEAHATAPTTLTLYIH
jgi:hypothetical protein